jgi:hypothetical protein
MAVPSLTWRSLTDSRSDRFFVKHTRVAVAFYALHRFGIYETRGPANADGSFDDYYIVTDAHTVSDAALREGKAPVAVHRSAGLDLAAVIAWCDQQA